MPFPKIGQGSGGGSAAATSDIVYSNTVSGSGTAQWSFSLTDGKSYVIDLETIKPAGDAAPLLYARFNSVSSADAYVSFFEGAGYPNGSRAALNSCFQSTELRLAHQAGNATDIVYLGGRVIIHTRNKVGFTHLTCWDTTDHTTPQGSIHYGGLGWKTAVGAVTTMQIFYSVGNLGDQSRIVVRELTWS